MPSSIPSHVKTSPYNLPKNDVFQAAKREIGNLDLGHTDLAEPGNNAPLVRCFQWPMSQETRESALILLDAAAQMIDPHAEILWDVDDQTIQLIFPSNYTHPPMQQIQQNVSRIRHALVASVSQQHDGLYRISPAKDLQTLDVEAFLKALCGDYAHQHHITTDLSDPKQEEVDWSRLAPSLLPEFQCYYEVAHGNHIDTQLMDSIRFKQLNLYAAQVGEKVHAPETCFHHAELNDAAMAMVNAAIGIRSSRATLH